MLTFREDEGGEEEGEGGEDMVKLKGGEGLSVCFLKHKMGCLFDSVLDPATRINTSTPRNSSNPCIFRGRAPRQKILLTSARDYAKETRYVEVRTTNGQYGHGMELNDPVRG